MDYPAYERAAELACQGDHVASYMEAIFANSGASLSKLASLQRRIYEDTEAGISISFQLDDGSFVWSGNKVAEDALLVRRVRKIGFSSIVEGSDAEVPLRWLDLLDEELDTADKFVQKFNDFVEQTDAEAVGIWDADNAE